MKDNQIKRYYNKNGVSVSESEIIYRGHRNVLEKVTFFSLDNGAISKIKIHRWRDLKGGLKMVEDFEYYPDSTLHRQIFKLSDGRGRIIEKYLLDEDGMVDVEYSRRMIRRGGRSVEEIRYHTDGRPHYKIIYPDGIIEMLDGEELKAKYDDADARIKKVFRYS